MEDSIGWLFLHVKALGFAMPRFLAVFTMLPLLSREALPTALRACVVAGFGVLLVPSLVDGVAHTTDPLAMLGVIIKEALIGSMIGVVLAIPLWALEMVGDLCDTQRGATIAQVLNPLTGNETSPLGQLFNQAIVTFLFVIGGLLLVVGVVYDSFRIWPVFGWWPQVVPDASLVALQMLDRLTRLAVLLGAPVIFCMFLAETGMAIVSRFVPQLQVFFLAMPVKSAIAMLVFAIYGVVLFDYSHGLLLETLRDANTTVRSMIKGAP